MKFKIDLHVHSKFSGDNDADPEETVLRALSAGLDGIAFTEHYSYGASEYAETLKEKFKERIRIFRGVELSSAEGHCLVFGVDTDALSVGGASVDGLVEIVNSSGGVVIPSHPYRRGTGLGDMIQWSRGLCAVEGYNGCNMPAYNEKAIEVAKALKLPYTGGSDAHSPGEAGLCFTEFDDEVTDENFIELLKRGNYRGVDRRSQRASGSNVWSRLLGL